MSTVTGVTGVTVRAPAKVNLQLFVGPLRDDGYHDLVNVFQSVSVYDEVTVSPAERLRVTVHGDDGIGTRAVPRDRTNLAAEAVAILAARTGRPPNVEISIRKRIPVAGGMAGGSADAAAALVACDELWQTGLGDRELGDLGARLGSDVPFMLMGGTAVGYGRGELLEPLAGPERFHWVFVRAETGLSTAEVYQAHSRSRASAGGGAALPPGPTTGLTHALVRGDARRLGAELKNDLHPTVFKLRPELEHLLGLGQEVAAAGAVVSGTGPTCAFLASSEEHADIMRRHLSQITGSERVLVAHGPVPGIERVPP
ncbi:4-(cytidine 5'-diphospho)-2-C-methyl-D-erythritol kinase [Sphaerisporangium sp. TRM90804]|uniref:4-(cytidine 5'-diphospho)-2-C-methyl-D-erythritol kinase n=1 Tax=Sphaerisporangium sp. TRM90804 TaxID=3031113 RepID=UPI00244A5CAE|nr:4-(cytidine 5'-diphospho)-2-C-methyl-D-erythritol kinase [Sphaerisporangium sp. TRM90804]MDH2424602.1 4-(cytidine 5'-diphospho)-2-C-methyl-D-erythritol kinase [Sphaerisporangium sp. TRM90804]